MGSHLGELLNAAGDTGAAQQWSWDPQSGPRHCGPLKELSDPEDPQMPEYALVPDDVARNFRCALCLENPSSRCVAHLAYACLVVAANCPYHCVGLRSCGVTQTSSRRRLTL
jgi:hypothetical protein